MELQEQLHALRDEVDQLRSDRDFEQQAYEQALASLREQHDAARQRADAAQGQPAISRTSVESVPAETEQRLAEVQSRLQQVETARSVLNDALKAARKQIEAMTIDLDEARLEQNRVRSILDGMGIHLI
jgi:chromosome segregation ATPase